MRDTIGPRLGGYFVHILLLSVLSLSCHWRLTITQPPPPSYHRYIPYGSCASWEPSILNRWNYTPTKPAAAATLSPDHHHAPSPTTPFQTMLLFSYNAASQEQRTSRLTVPSQCGHFQAIVVGCLKNRFFLLAYMPWFRLVFSPNKRDIGPIYRLLSTSVASVSGHILLICSGHHSGHTSDCVHCSLIPEGVLYMFICTYNEGEMWPLREGGGGVPRKIARADLEWGGLVADRGRLFACAPGGQWEWPREDDAISLLALHFTSNGTLLTPNKINPLGALRRFWWVNLLTKL